MNWAAIFTYDPENGDLRWRVSRAGRGCVAGSLAGGVGVNGYVSVTVNGRRYYAHRIGWEMVNGPIPLGRCLDHIDGNKARNAIANLRVVTLSGNQRNRRVARNSPLGISGVRAKKRGFEVRCAGLYVGFFDDFFEACCARKVAERRQGFHLNHGRAR